MGMAFSRTSSCLPYSVCGAHWNDLCCSMAHQLFFSYALSDGGWILPICQRSTVRCFITTRLLFRSHVS
jgi:hypothetical protein